MLNEKYIVILDDDFKKNLQKLSGKHQKLVLKKLRLLKINPFYPSLRTKKLMGSQDELFESSVNMDIRIFWRFDGEKVIVVLRVGHHDILKNY